jgi:hypothetical protein
MPPDPPAPITDPTPTPAAPVVDPAPAPAPSPALVESDPAKKPERPAWLGKPFDAYWSDDKGVDSEKLTADVEAAFAAKAEADERAKAVPEKLEDYKVELPEGMTLPAGMKMEILENHPALPKAREFAKKHGLSKDGFKELVALQGEAEIAEYNQLKAKADEQKALLGENANARVQALVTKATAKLGPELAKAILPMMFTAKQVEAMEKLVAEPASPSLNNNGREREVPPTISRDDFAKLPGSKQIEVGREIDAKRPKAN